MSAMNALTEKQQCFVLEYLKDLKAGPAYIRAGYKVKSPAVADAAASRLLRSVKVAAAVAEAMDERKEKLKIDANWVLQRLVEEATADLADLYCKDTLTLKPVHEWPMIFRMGLIDGIKTKELFDDEGNLEGYLREVKLGERFKRIDAIGKHVDVSAFRENVRTETVDVAAQLSAARDRVAKARRSGG